jgi:excisionase family DNA binding protein
MSDTYKNWDDLPLALTTKEVAEVLRVTETTVKNMLNAGTIPAAKFGRAWRINRDDLLAYLRGQKPLQSPQSEN